MVNNVDYFSSRTSCNIVPMGIKYLADNYKHVKSNLDYGGGKYEAATKYLADFGITNHVYDPYNRTPEHNTEALSHYYDSVTLLNVLNTIEDRSERVEAVRNAFSYMSYNGVLIIQIYEGTKSGIGTITKKKTYRHNQPMGKYIREICEGLGIGIFHFTDYVKWHRKYKIFVITNNRRNLQNETL